MLKAVARSRSADHLGGVDLAVDELLGVGLGCRRWLEAFHLQAVHCFGDAALAGVARRRRWGGFCSGGHGRSVTSWSWTEPITFGPKTVVPWFRSALVSGKGFGSSSPLDDVDVARGMKCCPESTVSGQAASRQEGCLLRGAAGLRTCVR